VEFIELILSKQSLTMQEMQTAMEFALTGTDPHQIAVFLAILKHRGETVDELLGMKRAIEQRAQLVDISFPVLDIVGTGGDGANTVNISTGAAILTAACGIPIAKHGSRSFSSRSGSADVLEALGIHIEVPPHKVNESLRAANLVFLFAPYYHPGLKHLSAIRRGLKFPTAINLLGPLLNPARAPYSLIGVSSMQALELISQVVQKDQSKKRTLVFHGKGLDELSPLGTVTAYEIQGGKRTKHDLDPQALGFAPCELKDLQGGDAVTNAAILHEVFAGKQSAVADAIVFNAGAALWIFGMAGTIQEGIERAKYYQTKGKGLETLNKWKAFSESLKEKQV
jgi:anthranilate phosphoribosyltransferase